MKFIFKKRGWLKKWAILAVVALLAGMGVVHYAHRTAVAAGEGRIFRSELPSEAEGAVAIVLGCSPKLGSGANPFFEQRIEAALRLYETGQVSCFLLSGDNRRDDYNEPEAMKARLVEGGVPAECCNCDYAGLRTLDTVVRAKEVFGVDRAVFVSQKFHLERSLYLAEQHGLTAWGWEADGVSGSMGLRSTVRERLARVKMLVDTAVGVEPRHYGEPVSLSGR